MKLVLATRNADKIREITQILEDLDIILLSLEEYPDLAPVVEDGKTFEENALKKACAASAFTHEIALAEDSGLSVDYLHGAPGVLSRRFAGELASYAENNAKLLSLLGDVPPERRTAAFICVVALSLPNGTAEVFRGICKGSISVEPTGSSGFGYDPVFVVPEYGKTFAELGSAVKNRLSHRAMALRKARVYLKNLLCPPGDPS